MELNKLAEDIMSEKLDPDYLDYLDRARKATLDDTDTELKWDEPLPKISHEEKHYDPLPDDLPDIEDTGSSDFEFDLHMEKLLKQLNF